VEFYEFFEANPIARYILRTYGWAGVGVALLLQILALIIIIKKLSEINHVSARIGEVVILVLSWLPAVNNVFWWVRGM